jgi:hypothetical protein
MAVRQLSSSKDYFSRNYVTFVELPSLSCFRRHFYSCAISYEISSKRISRRNVQCLCMVELVNGSSNETEEFTKSTRVKNIRASAQ